MCRLPALAATLILTMTLLFSRAEAENPPVKEIDLKIATKNLALPRTIPVHLWIPAHIPFGKESRRVPLLLFFHGWGGHVAESTSLCAGLAARGFIVAGVSYPEGSGLPDPKIPMQFTSDSAFAAGCAQGNRMVEIQAVDASDVLDALLAPPPPGQAAWSYKHIDPKKIGVLGYSLGGAVSAQTALHDPRVRAVMNLDGWMFGDAVKERFPQPYLVISDGLAPATETEMNSDNQFLRHFARLRASDRLVQNAQLAHSGGYRVTIAGSDHFTFADQAVKGQPGTGTIDPPRAREIVEAFAADFFAHQLQGRPYSLLAVGLTKFPEAKIESFPSPR
jgi:dienelactone hydrolase